MTENKIKMERYGSDTEGDEQETPLLHRGHEDKAQRGEMKLNIFSWLANNSVALKLGSFRATHGVRLT